MRTATAITLVLLGGGATATAVYTTRDCYEPLTGAPRDACSNSGSYHGGGGHWYFHSGYGARTGSGSSSASVSRGGFGGFGAAAHASS